MFLPSVNSSKGIVIFLAVILQLMFYQNSFAQISDPPASESLEMQAEQFMSHAAYDSAILLFNELKDKTILITDWRNTIKFTLRIVEAYRSADRFAETDSCLNQIENSKNYRLDQFPLLKAEFLHQKGTSLGNQGNYISAIDILNQSIKIRVGFSGMNSKELAKTYNNIGAYNYYIGEFAKAIKLYEQAIRIVDHDNDRRSDLASYLQNVGIIYARMGDFEEALTNFNKALKINEVLLNQDDPSIAHLNINLGQFFSLLGRYGEALDFNNRAERFFLEKFGKDYSTLGTVYLNKSRIYSNLSDPEEAEKYLKNALNIYNLHLQPNHPNIARAYNNLGIVAMAKKNYAEAIEYFKKSLDIKKETDSQSIQLRNLAEAYSKIEFYEEAEMYYKRSIFRAKSELGENHYEYGSSLVKYAEFLINQKRFSEVEKVMQVAIDNYLLNYKERNANIAEVYLLYGQYFEKIGDYKKSLEQFQKAIIANNYSYTQTDVLQNPSLDSVISESLFLTSLLNKADVFSKLYKDYQSKDYLNAGLTCYQEAMPVFERLRSKLKYESKFILMEKTSSHFDYAYEHYYNNYLANPGDSALNFIFEFTEKNKAAVLLSSMKDMDAIKFGGIPEEKQNIEKQLKERISGYENLIYDQKELRKPDSTKIVLWEQRLFDLTNQYDSLITVFGKEYPSYYDLKYDNRVMTLSETQKGLSDDEVIIEYTLTDSSLYAFFIDKKGSSYYKTAVDSVFFKNLATLQAVSEIDFANHSLTDYKKYVNSSHGVYQVLFSDFDERIEGKKLIIIPDGRLGYLSFESLVSKLPDMQSINYRSLDYLIKKHPISYSYSSTLLFKNNIERSGRNEVLAFAPSYEYSENQKEEESALRQMTNRLKPLVNAQEEVANVINIFHGDVYSNAKATETNFKLNSKGYDVLHLAMHTIIDDEDPMYSKMVFTMDNDSTNDGYLNTFEIYNLNLKAQLAVLSACNTGSGKIRNGEGIMSLARGFIYAGVPSIVMTLWEVDDKSGADIMTNFYSYLKEGQTKDVALQNAKLKYLSTASQLRAHPYFWSAYVNVGNSKPLRKSHQYDFIIYTGIILLVIFVIIYYWRQKNHPR